MSSSTGDLRTVRFDYQVDGETKPLIQNMSLPKYLQYLCMSQDLARYEREQEVNLTCEGVSLASFRKYEQYIDATPDPTKPPSIEIDSQEYLELRIFAEHFDIIPLKNGLNNPGSNEFVISDPGILDLRKLLAAVDDDSTSASILEDLKLRVRETLREALVSELFLKVPVSHVVDILEGVQDIVTDDFGKYLTKAIDAGLAVDPLFSYLNWGGLSLEAAEPLLESVRRAETAGGAGQGGVGSGEYRTLVDLSTVLELQGRRKKAQKDSQTRVDKLRELITHAPGANHP